MDLSIPVALLHVAAFSMGYFICKGLGFNEKTSRTVSIETGIQICRASSIMVDHVTASRSCIEGHAP